jgi:hypothetical protein
MLEDKIKIDSIKAQLWDIEHKVAPEINAKIASLQRALESLEKGTPTGEGENTN